MTTHLIERYAAAVAKRLPAKGRADIEKELRSTLEDMLEDRAAKNGQPAGEALTRELLKEYGSPQRVAASYLPERHLIGPRIYPFFIMVLKIVFSVLSVLALIGLGLAFAQRGAGDGPALAALGQTLLDYLQGLIQAFGNIVLVFAVLERVLPKEEFDTESKDWDPAELEAEAEPDEVKPWEPILAILFSAAFLIIFNFYPNAIGFSFTADNGSWVSAPVLTAAFFKLLPWINLNVLLSIGLNLYLFRQGRWQPLTRGLDLDLNALTIAICVLMLNGPTLVTFSIAQLAEAGPVLDQVFRTLIPSILVVIIVLTAIDMAQTVYKLLKQGK